MICISKLPQKTITQPQQSIMATKFFKIFRAGTHRAMAGQTITFSDKEVSDIATYYPLGVKKAPLVLGHPGSNGPALGVVLSLHEKHGALFASADSSDELTNLVRAKQCTGVSCAFVSKGDPLNPVPGMWSLKHVGFMVGGMQPAIKDLGALEFSEHVGAYMDASFVDLSGMTSEVSFAEAQQGGTPYQRNREALHYAALRTVAAHPEYSYFEAVSMFERRI